MTSAEVLARLEDATDRLNPIVVKELRQALRARVFVLSFSGLLLACVFFSLTIPLDQNDGDPAGRTLFAIYLSGLVIVTLGVLPFNVFRALAKELQDESWPSLALTPLGARRIVRGRIASGMAQSALYASAVGPFLFFSYMLEGVGLTTILLALVLVALSQPLATAFAVCAATIAQQRALRGLLLLAMLVAFTSLAGSGIGLLADFLRHPTLPTDPEQLVALALVVVGTLTLTHLLAEVATARLATTAENTARGPRLALVAHLVPFTVAAITLDGGTSSSMLTTLALVYTCLLAFASGAVGLGDPAAAPVALRGSSRWSVLVPGRRGALRFAIALASATAVVTLLRTGRQEDVWPVFVAFPALLAIHLSLAATITPLLPAAVSDAPDARRFVPLVLVTLASAVPPLVGGLVLLDPTDPFLNLLNPFVIAIKSSDADVQWVPIALLALAPLAFLAADRVLAGEERDALAKEAARR